MPPENQPAHLDLSVEREIIGKRLYLFAWIIEIFAVAIGLGIAIMQFVTSFNELNEGKNGQLGFGDWTNMAIAAVPFVMVSVVELTKIPFVDAFYRTTHRLWKAVFLISLLVISGITFESALNGFERNLAAMNITVNRLQKELLVTEESMVPIEERIERTASLTIEQIEEDYTTRYQELASQRADMTNVVDERKRALRASIQSEYTAGLQEQIQAARAEIQDLRDGQRESLAAHTNRFNVESQTLLDGQQTTIRSRAQDYEREQKRLDDLMQRGAEDIESANIFTRASVKERLDEELAKQQAAVDAARQRLDEARSGQVERRRSEQFRAEQEQIRNDYAARIAAVQDRIDGLNGDYNQSIGTREKDVEKTLTGYDKEIVAIEEKFSGQFEEIKQLRDDQLRILGNNTTLIAEWDGELDSLRERRVELRDAINTAVGNNQIYRMAQLFSGAESAADVQKEVVTTVATIWFASLAAMVAFTGVILAMASNVIRDRQIPDVPQKDRPTVRGELKGAIRTVRRWFIYRRKLQRKPVIKERIREITKEIPVDRVVRTEVPVEILRKEIVHIPLYTNDPKLLKMGVKIEVPESQATPASDVDTKKS